MVADDLDRLATSIAFGVLLFESSRGCPLEKKLQLLNSVLAIILLSGALLTLTLVIPRSSLRNTATQDSLVGHAPDSFGFPPVYGSAHASVVFPCAQKKI